MATVIDTLFIELGIDASKFSGEAQQATEKLEKMEKAFDKSEAATKRKAEQSKKNETQIKNLGTTITAVMKGFVAFTSILMGASGLTKLASDIAQANRELDNLSQNLGMASKDLASWQGVAGMAGGSAAGLSGYLQTLSGNMTSLVMMGDTSMLPYFNALGVSMLDGSGKARELDDVLLDLADSMSSMDRVQAFNIAKQMGMDDGTANMLLKGRAEVERMLVMQKELYRSNQQDMENSKKFAETRAYMNQQWESFKLMLGNALLPVVIEVSKVVSGFLSYLMKNERQVKAVFLGMSTAIGLALIPVLLSATAAAWAFIAPFLPAILIVTALGAAFVLLYDDYLTWANGGKSLFDWGKFIDYIKSTNISVNSLMQGFTYLLTGYKSWSEAGNALFDWLRFKGFIDETGVSVESLKTGFLNLAHDIKESLMPYLQDLINVFMRLKDGDFNGAWEAVKIGTERRWNLVKDLAGAIGERVGNAGDIATGHDVGTLAGNKPDSNNIAAASQAKALPKGKLSADKLASIQRVAKNIGVDPNDLAAVISFETSGTFSPKAINKKSSATGLIQFMKGTDGYKGYYGMSRQAFASLSFDEQMNYVEKYFKKRGFRADKKQDVANLYTAVTGYGYKRGSKAYELNKVWDSNKDGYIDKGEMVQNKHFRAHQKNYFYNMPLQKQPIQSKKLSEIPIVGQAVADNLANHHRKIQSEKVLAKPQKVVHNQKTEVVVQTVNINTSSSTMKGAGKDMAQGISSNVTQLNIGMV